MPERADLGDPATDPPLTLRIAPGDNPMDQHARRAIKALAWGWLLVTAPDEDLDDIGAWVGDEDVASWPYTNRWDLRAATAGPADDTTREAPDA